MTAERMDECAAPQDAAALAAEKSRLETLVCELLAKNEELRFHVARLSEQAQTAERGLKSACAHAALLWPL